MAGYAVTVARSARRELEALPTEIARRVLVRIETLTRQPRPRGCTKIRGQNHLWRVRVGDYRVVYEVNDGDRVVAVLVVRHRGDVYR